MCEKFLSGTGRKMIQHLYIQKTQQHSVLLCFGKYKSHKLFQQNLCRMESFSRNTTLFKNQSDTTTQLTSSLISSPELSIYETFYGTFLSSLNMPSLMKET